MYRGEQRKKQHPQCILCVYLTAHVCYLWDDPHVFQSCTWRMRGPRQGWAWAQAGAVAEGTAAITGLAAVQITQEIPFSNKWLGNLAASLLSGWWPNPRRYGDELSCPRSARSCPRRSREARPHVLPWRGFAAAGELRSLVPSPTPSVEHGPHCHARATGAERQKRRVPGGEGARPFLGHPHSIMTLQDDFDGAAEDVKKLKTRPTDDELKELYGFYKQATVGDINIDMHLFWQNVQEC
ncbi:acyl-CoA-binding domain-containing protein 7 isoform X2 [Aquila chrysaetos chrysaetos]|uniref:acyl-CoA-binding domain-containing protein 7 isoform X2 n=1 Tax=Aquila chrysaetos chrysaetos TaxID=223781 RepID=UPI001B7D32EB|nr:acyl-CoA-binding domain-containing protein 7 isoform X2 [Aquila chrysaetos chrysaetos]